MAFALPPAGREARCRWIRVLPGTGCFMEALLASTVLVAVAEIGDKTQLLAIVLATRFRKPVPIVLGILVETLANHAIAAFAGQFASELLDGLWFRFSSAASFIDSGMMQLIAYMSIDL